MRPDSIAQLMRAADGDAVALAACMRNSDDLDRLAALVLLDPEPHPLATLTAFAAIEDPPAALRARMRAVAPAALRALHDAPDNDLVAVLRSRLRERDVAELMDDLTPPSVMGDARALAGLTRLSARCAAAVWSKAGADIAPGDGDGLSLDDRRVVLARAVAQPPPHPIPPQGGGSRRGGDAADLIAGIGAEGWKNAPEEARQTLLDAVANDPRSAAKSGAAWGGMRPDERVRLAIAAAQRSYAAAALIAGIGAEGWKSAPEEARQMLLDAVANDPWSAATSGAAWGGMRPDERVRLTRAAAQISDTAASLVLIIGSEGWKIAPDEARSALLNAVANDPRSAAKSGAAWGGMRPDERARLARSAAQRPAAAADLIARIDADGWAGTPDDARQALLDTLASVPYRTATSGAAWGGMRPDERARLAIAAAQSPENAINLIERIGADGWAGTPDDARRALLDALANAPLIAARSSAAWGGMRPDERTRLACIVAQPPPQPLPQHGGGARRGEAVAFLIARIGADGWASAPEDARQTLLDVLDANPWDVVRSVAAWGGMRPDERLRLARVAAHSPTYAANLIAAIGADGWAVAPDDARRTLLDALANDPWSAAWIGSAWTFMRPDERLRLAHAAARRPESVANLIERIGADGWAVAPDDARRTLLDALANDPWSAAKSGAAWGGMRPDERACIARRAAQIPEAAADLIERIGADGWAVAPNDARAALLDAAATEPFHAVRSGAAWNGMRPDERLRLARRAAQIPEAAADLIARIGADGWECAPADARRTLLNALANDPWSAAKSGAAWGGMRPDERARLARAAAQSPEAAADLIGRIGAGWWEGAPDDARSAILAAVTRAPHHALKTLFQMSDRLDSEQRAALGFAALGGASAVPALAQALAGGLTWRDRMAIFLPAANDDADVRDAWRAALQSLPPETLRQALARLPHSVAAALAPRRRASPST